MMHMMMPMFTQMAEMAARDRAAAPCDPATLTEQEKCAKILALQSRVAELEHVGAFLVSRVAAIETETCSAGADDRSYRAAIRALCADTLRHVVIPVTITDPVSGGDVLLRRAL